MDHRGFGVPAAVTDDSGAAARPVLDEELFTRLLAAAYVMQQHRDHVQSKAPAPDFQQIISEVVDTQYLIHTRGDEATAALNLIAVRLQKLSGASGAAIGLLEGENLEYKSAVGSAAGLSGTRSRADACLSFSCLTSGEPLRSPLADLDARVSEALRRRTGARSVLAVPIYRDGKAAGAIELFFSRPSAFGDNEVRACELMAGLVSEVMSKAAEQELKHKLATERATVLMALQTLKPKLERLANESAGEIANPPLQTHTTGTELQGKWATLWERRLAAEAGQSAADSQNAEEKESLRANLGDVPLNLDDASGSDRDWHAPAAFSWPGTTVDSDHTSPAPEELGAPLADAGKPGNADEEEEISLAVASPEALEPAPSPWSSVAGARRWLKLRFEEKDWRDRLRTLWRIHSGDISLALAAVAVALALLWSASPTSPASGAPAPQVQAVKRRPRPKPPQLTFFEQVLVSLGLAEPPPTPAYMGNPEVQVWVDLQTALYYCPGSELYGKTPKGKYTTQGDAVQDQFEPAQRKACD